MSALSHNFPSLRSNPALRSGYYYKDDVGGVYRYYDGKYDNNPTIQIVVYPKNPSLNGSNVFKSIETAKFNAMVAVLSSDLSTELGSSIGEPAVKSAISEANGGSFSPAAPSPSSYIPESPAIDTSGYVSTAPQDRLPEKPGRGAKPKKQPQQDEVNYLPWVIGGGILTLGLGLAIIFIPIKKRKE